MSAHTFFLVLIQPFTPKSYIIPVPTIMAWCTAAACGGVEGLLCNLGVPSVAVSWRCHLVGLTQSPRQHSPTIGASTATLKCMWHAWQPWRTEEKCHEVDSDTPPSVLHRMLQFLGRRNFSVMISKDHTQTDFCSKKGCMWVTVLWAYSPLCISSGDVMSDQQAHTRWSQTPTTKNVITQVSDLP